MKCLNFLFLSALSLLHPMQAFARESAPAIDEVAVSAQQQPQANVVSGKVIDANGSPIIGASVKVKGTNIGAVTDAEGGFSLNVKGKVSLQISYIGYTSKEVNAVPGNPVSVVLDEDRELLDEVVVVGYGIQKKVNLSGAVESVKGENIASKTTIQTSDALQGMMPGVTITTNSGKPGESGMAVRIRGIGTLNSNDPLVLIDGVASSLDAIDPNDIDNISVLKDAASAAIYGSRAANGVILITTKTGKSEKVSLTYRASVSLTSPVKRLKFVNAWDYMTLYDEALGNDLRDDSGKPGGVMYGQELIDTWRNATDRDAYPNSDAWNETYRSNAIQTQHYVGVSGGNDKIQTNTSVNFAWQDALIPNADFKRYGIRSNNKYILNDYLEVFANISLRQSDNKDPASVESYCSLSGLYRQPAIYATQYSNGVWGTNYAGTIQEAQSISEKLAMTYKNYNEFITKVGLTIKPVAGLRVNFFYAPKLYYNSSKVIAKKGVRYDYKTGEVIYRQTLPAYRNESRTKTRQDDINLVANYNIEIGKHEIGAIAGFQYLKSLQNSLTGYRDGNEFSQFEEMDSFDKTNMSNSGTSSEWALMSYFGRVNYAFAGKYLVEANLRYDGSSRFAKGRKWGLFPSVSAAWRFSEESFMKDLTWWTNGKIRASWGKLGNQEGLGGNYPFALNVSTSQYAVFDNQLASGFAPVNYALSEITWESTKMLDFGIDLGFLNNSLNLSFDWYKKNTDNMLLSMAIPGVMGYSNSPKQNAGSVENIGWDLTITYANRTGNVDYKITGVLSDVRNRITDLGGLGPQVSGKHVNMVGEPINSLYGYIADGYFSSFEEARKHPISQWGKLQGGDIKYVDSNGNGKMDGDDRQVIGNVIPRYTFSLDLFASWKGFDLDIFFQGVGKRDTYFDGWAAYPFFGNATALDYHFDRWTESNPNPNARFPRLAITNRTNNEQASTHWLLNGAYLRLKNVSLSYTFNKDWFRGSGINGLRLFATGNNLLTFDKLPDGMDPESPENMHNGFPLVRTYTFGLEIKF